MLSDAPTLTIERRLMNHVLNVEIPNEDHWWKCGSNSGTGLYCIYTGLAHAAQELTGDENHPSVDKCMKLIAEKTGREPVREHDDEFNVVISWNDDPATTYEDMRSVLEAVREKL